MLAEAEFDPKLKLYMYLNSCFLLLVTLIGIPLLPIWLFVGPIWARRYFESLSCTLTDRKLIVKKGVFFRTEKTIPLDKIQDFSLKEGPFLRKLGLTVLNVETAGQSSPQGGAEAGLIGLKDVFGFRDRVLAQRDKVSSQLSMGHQLSLPEAASDSHEVLLEIRDSLHRIEQALSQQTEHKP